MEIYGKKHEVKIGIKVRCKAIGFSLPIIGTIKYIYNNTAVIFIEQVQVEDQSTAVEKNYMAVALIEEIK